MLDDFKFVMGAVAKTELIPTLTHFVIENGRVRGYNGTLALSSPVPFDIVCKPKAAPLVKALSACSETVTLNMTPAGRLRIKSGKLTAYVDCAETEVTPHVEPEGENIEINGEILIQAFSKLEPFIGTNIHRMWSCGVLIKGQSAFATNNVVAVESWLGFNLPDIVIPRQAVRELVRIGKPPTHIQIAKNSVTFHFESGRWIRTQLLDAEKWPNIEKILNVKSNALPIDEKIFDGLDVLRHHVDNIGRVFFIDGALKTSQDAEQGATFELDDFNYSGCFNIEMLRLLKYSVDTIDFSAYPRPSLFFGKGLRGAIMGIRLNAQ